MMQLTTPYFDEKELENLKACLDSGWVTQGPFVEKLEQQVANFHRAKHAMATTSCTAALHLAMLALEIKPGDEVIVPAFTWITSANCAEYLGAKAVFVDVRADTFNIDTEALKNAINENTRAIVPVHLFGLAADMDEINEIARKRDIYVVEDAACAIGTFYKDEPVGGLGDLGCFSFHPRKVVTTGEGGMVTTNDSELAERVQSFRNHGSTGVADGKRPRAPWTMATFDRLGYNLRMSDIQGAVGVAQVDKLASLLEERRRLARRYSELLSGLEEIARPTDGIDCQGHTFQSYVIRVLKGGQARRNSIMEAFEAAEISTRPGTHAVTTLGYYTAKYGLAPGSYPVAEDSQNCTITLPLFPGMRDEQQQEVVRCLERCLLSS